MAVACEHMSWPTALVHLDVISQLAEAERLKGRSPYVAFIYDQMVRQQWARRAEKKDPSSDIVRESEKVGKELLHVVYQRCANVLEEAGMGSNPGSASGMGNAHAMANVVGPSEAAAQKILAAADQASKQATMAAQGLVKAQQDILWKSHQLGSHGGGSQPKGKGEGKKVKAAKNDHESRKSRKGRAWHEKTDERKKWQNHNKHWAKP